MECDFGVFFIGKRKLVLKQFVKSVIDVQFYFVRMDYSHNEPVFSIYLYDRCIYNIWMMEIKTCFISFEMPCNNICFMLRYISIIGV